MQADPFAAGTQFCSSGSLTLKAGLSPQAELERLTEELSAVQDARQAAAAQQERLSKALHAAKQQVKLPSLLWCAESDSLSRRCAALGTQHAACCTVAGTQLQYQLADFQSALRNSSQAKEAERLAEDRAQAVQRLTLDLNAVRVDAQASSVNNYSARAGGSLYTYIHCSLFAKQRRRHDRLQKPWISCS